MYFGHNRIARLLSQILMEAFSFVETVLLKALATTQVAVFNRNAIGVRVAVSGV